MHPHCLCKLFLADLKVKIAQDLKPNRVVKAAGDCVLIGERIVCTSLGGGWFSVRLLDRCEWPRQTSSVCEEIIFRLVNMHLHTCGRVEERGVTVRCVTGPAANPCTCKE